MKQIIPFEKDILFKTKIGELTSISLDNDLSLVGEDLVKGNFYLKGTYKMIASSVEEEEYSYKIPCEIQISSDYDAYDCTIDIDDFIYDIKDNDTLSIKISVLLDNLNRKEIEISNVNEEIDQVNEEELPIEEEVFERESSLDVFNDIKSDIISDVNERYLTYKVYTVKEEDTIDMVCNKYKVSIDDIKDYNDFDSFTTGLKLVIPGCND